MEELSTTNVKRDETPLEAGLTELARAVDRHAMVLSQLQSRLSPVMRDPYPQESAQDIPSPLGDSELIRTLGINTRNIAEQTEALMTILSRLEV